MSNQIETEPKFIFVSFITGTSGSFISVLVNLFFNKDFNYKFSNYGSAHEAGWTCGKAALESSENDTTGVDNIQLFIYNLDYPYVLRTHCADVKYLTSKYIDSKVIHISFSDNQLEIEKIFYNHYFKYWIGETTNPSSLKNFQESTKFWIQYTDTKKLPTELAPAKIAYLASRDRLQLIKSLHITRFNLPNVLDIPFSKINLGDYSILEDLSSFLSMPINPSVIHAFNEYYKLQSLVDDFINRL